MRILLDHCTPLPLRRYLAHHDVTTAYLMGWATMRNGELIAQAARNGFDLLISADQSIKYQQSLANRQIAILVLMSSTWPRLEPIVGHIVEYVDHMRPGEYREVELDPK